MAEERAGTLKLKSNDGKEFEVSESACKISEFLIDTPRNEDKEVTEIEIPRVSGETLEKVVEYMKHYAEEKMKEVPTPLGGTSFDEVMDQKWYNEFVAEDKMERDLLFSMLSAANFLGIKPLLDLTCLKVTFMICGKEAAEIKKILKQEDDKDKEEVEGQ